jgi:hypothetical protein
VTLWYDKGVWVDGQAGLKQAESKAELRLILRACSFPSIGTGVGSFFQEARPPVGVKQKRRGADNKRRSIGE